jgi:CDP-paratose 2-epimerase
MLVLITGHEGFVGRYLTGMLVKAGHEVIGMDIRDQNRHAGGTGPDLAKDDVAFRAIENRKPAVVVHLASSVSTPGSLERPLETFRNTVRTAVNVIDACRLTETPLILTSSVKARDALTPYGVSKRMVEMWAQDYVGAYGLKCVINRPGTIYGPGQEGSPESGWIAWFLKAKRERLKVVVHRPGTQIRDLLHVKDYCRLLMLQMTKYEHFDGKLWDVGGGWRNAVSIVKMAEHLGLDWSFGPERYGDELEYVGFNQTPGWEPQIRWETADVFQE